MTDQNTNPDYYKDELYLDEDFRMLAKTYPADVSAIGVTTLIDYVEAVEAELARRDEIIKRLKEDGDRLSEHLILDSKCYFPRIQEQIRLDILAHRALMKELENG